MIRIVTRPPSMNWSIHSFSRYFQVFLYMKYSYVSYGLEESMPSFIEVEFHLDISNHSEGLLQGYGIKKEYQKLCLTILCTERNSGLRNAKLSSRLSFVAMSRLSFLFPQCIYGMLGKELTILIRIFSN
jgi:hypothetical protein